MTNLLAYKRKRRDHSKVRFKTVGDHREFLQRIRKTLYYGELPLTERLSLPVTEFAAELFSEVASGKRLDRLHLEDAAEISRNACVSPCSFVLAMLYLERLKALNPQYVDKVAPSELFLVSMMVASKFLNDDGEDDEVLNSEWAASAKLSTSEVNALEKEFLKAINWEVFVHDAEFWSALKGLEKILAVKEGQRRGFYSYTELENLLGNLDAYCLTQALFTISVVCLASYTAAVLTLLGSTALVTHISTLCLISHHNQSSSVLIPSLVTCPLANDTHLRYLDFLTDDWAAENNTRYSLPSIEGYWSSITQHLSYFPVTAAAR